MISLFEAGKLGGLKAGKLESGDFLVRHGRKGQCLEVKTQLP